jgi:hypothetical protein
MRLTTAVAAAGTEPSQDGLAVLEDSAVFLADAIYISSEVKFDKYL